MFIDKGSKSLKKQQMEGLHIRVFIMMFDEQPILNILTILYHKSWIFLTHGVVEH